jgi:acetolactate synthase I/II/III large subunit
VSERITVGEAVARVLEGAGVDTAFGVISIHNMPICDAIGRRGKIRFVPARGEAGAAHMADGYARRGRRLGVVVTSTGAGAFNAAGALGEAQVAGTPLIHLTGQIDYEFIDRKSGYVHEAVDQLSLLQSVSKAALRVRSPQTAIGTIREAIRLALTPPRGPVSVEIPIDFQKAELEIASDADFVLPLIAALPPDTALIDDVAALLRSAKRPVLLLGAGARDASAAALRFAKMGWAIVTSTAGRGIVPEDNPMSLGPFMSAPATEALYATCDAIIVAGSRLRGYETIRYTVQFPRPRVLIDVDELARDRNFAFDRFVCANALLSLDALADRLEGRMSIDPALAADVSTAREKMHQRLVDNLETYGPFFDEIGKRFGEDATLVRDVTLANAWGRAFPALVRANQGMHSISGGIGQGLPMAIGAATANSHGRVYSIVGDGGLALTLGELGTLAQENLPITLIVMNDSGYGVIRNIQDAEYSGRNYFVDLTTPDFSLVARAYGIQARTIESTAEFAAALDWAKSVSGPVLLDVKMSKIGAFPKSFAGPPKRQNAPKPEAAVTLA